MAPGKEIYIFIITALVICLWFYLIKSKKFKQTSYFRSAWRYGKPLRSVTFIVGGLLLMAVPVIGQQALRASESKTWLQTPATLDGIDEEGVHPKSAWAGVSGYREKVYCVRYHILVDNVKYEGKSRLYLDDYKPTDTPLFLEREAESAVAHRSYEIRERAVQEMRSGHLLVYFNQKDPKQTTIVRREPNWLLAGGLLVFAVYLLHTAIYWKAS